MTVKVKDTGTEILAYSLDNRFLGRFDPEVFYTQVLSPRQLRSYERNPDLCTWDVRRLDFNNNKK